jgi:hypothetical protein
VGRDLWFLILFCTPGVGGSLSDPNGNRCYADAPLSDRLRLQAPRLVRSFFAFLSPRAQWDRCHFRKYQNLQVSNLVFARTKQTDATPTTLNRIEVTVHTAFEQHPTAQKSDDYSSGTSTNEKGSPAGPTSDDDSSTIISTSENMSHIVGDSSKLDPSQASAHPPPTVSPSPQAQSV